MTVKRVKGTSAPKGVQQNMVEQEEIPPVGISEDDSGAEVFEICAHVDRSDLVVSGVDLNNNKVSEPRD